MRKNAEAFFSLAASSGLTLTPDQRASWLNPRGHASPVVRSEVSRQTQESIRSIFLDLGGDEGILEAKTRGSMTLDFLFGNQAVEYDEVQHFTRARLMTFRHYPQELETGFSVDEYRRLCSEWRVRGERGFAHKNAAEFPGDGGRMRQRAYFDSFRDLVGPYFGHGPVIRIPAPDDDYVAAVSRLKSAVKRT